MFIFLSCSGQVEIMSSDYFDCWGPKVPKIKFKPNTSILDVSIINITIACDTSKAT